MRKAELLTPEEPTLLHAPVTSYLRGRRLVKQLSDVVRTLAMCDSLPLVLHCQHAHVAAHWPS